MSNERSLGRRQLADMEAEITRLNGVLIRNESERVNRKREWEDLVAQREEDTRTSEQQRLQLINLASRAGTERSGMRTQLTEAYEEIKELKGRLELGPALPNSENQGGREPLGETETTAEPERERTLERVEDLTGSPEVDYGGSTDEGEKEDEGKEEPQRGMGRKGPRATGRGGLLSGVGVAAHPHRIGRNG